MMSSKDVFDVAIVGGGPAGATAAEALAMEGHRVLLLERGNRIKPCGGAIPPRLMEDFHITDAQLVAKVNTARMISPTQRHVDIPIENGFVRGVMLMTLFPLLGLLLPVAVDNSIITLLSYAMLAMGISLFLPLCVGDEETLA